MTNLLTPSDQTSTTTATDTPAPPAPADRHTFRAATLDDAIALARTELGDDVELIEAHRVRRGGLGGFFATDLGVEIVAAPRHDVIATPTIPTVAGAFTGAAVTGAGVPAGTTRSAADAASAAATHEVLSIPTVQPAPSTESVLPITPASDEVVTALDRLIQHAESIDRSIPVEHGERRPIPSLADELDPMWWNEEIEARASDPGSFEAHLASEIEAADAADTRPRSLPTPIVDLAPPTSGRAAGTSPIAAIGGATATGTETSVAADDLEFSIDELLSRPLDHLDQRRSPLQQQDESTAAAEDDTDGASPTEHADTVDQMTIDDDTIDDETIDDDTIDDETPTDDKLEIDEIDEMTIDDAADDATDAEIDETPMPGAAAVALAPPSPLLNPTLAGSDGSLAELDDLLRDVGISIEAIEAPTDPAVDVDTSLDTIEQLARLATSQLVEGAIAASRRAPMSRLSLSVTAADGTTVTVATEFDDRHSIGTGSTTFGLDLGPEADLDETDDGRDDAGIARQLDTEVDRGLDADLDMNGASDD